VDYSVDVFAVVTLAGNDMIRMDIPFMSSMSLGTFTDAVDGVKNDKQDDGSGS